MELYKYDAVTISNMVNGGETSSAEVAQSYLDRIDTINPRLNALTVINRAPITHSTGSIAGVPFTTKITTDHAGYPTDEGMIKYRHSIPSKSVAIIQGLEQSGGTMVGRTNSPELGQGLDCDNYLHGATINPFDALSSPGGSTGGGAVAVATGMCAIAQGNDTGGSIRWPAFCNGLIGLRPTMGRMPVNKINNNLYRTNYNNLISTNGLITRTIDDMWLGLNAMLSCYDSSDPNFYPVPLENFGPDVPQKVALVTDDYHKNDTYADQALSIAANHLIDAGYEVDLVNPPMLEQMFDLWKWIVLPERHETEIDLKAYFGLLAQRDSIIRSWLEFMQEYPLLLTITNSRHSSKIGYHNESKENLEEVYRQMRYLFGLVGTGLPVLQIPIDVNLPRPNGVQLIAPTFREDLLYKAGKAIEDREGRRQVIDIFSVL